MARAAPLLVGVLVLDIAGVAAARDVTIQHLVRNTDPAPWGGQIGRIYPSWSGAAPSLRDGSIAFNIGGYANWRVGIWTPGGVRSALGIGPGFSPAARDWLSFDGTRVVAASQVDIITESGGVVEVIADDGFTFGGFRRLATTTGLSVDGGAIVQSAFIPIGGGSSGIFGWEKGTRWAQLAGGGVPPIAGVVFDAPQIDGDDVWMRVDGEPWRFSDGRAVPYGDVWAPPGSSIPRDIERWRVEGENSVFFATAADRRGLYAHVDGASRVIVDQDTVLPSGRRIGQQPPRAFSISGEHVVFLIEDDDYWMNLVSWKDGVLTQIASERDGFGGMPFPWFEMSWEAVEGDRVAFSVRLQDGTEVLAMATVPAPASGLVLVVLGAMVRGRRG